MVWSKFFCVVWIMHSSILLIFTANRKLALKITLRLTLWNVSHKNGLLKSSWHWRCSLHEEISFWELPWKISCHSCASFTTYHRWHCWRVHLRHACQEIFSTSFILSTLAAVNFREWEGRGKINSFSSAWCMIKSLKLIRRENVASSEQMDKRLWFFRGGEGALTFIQ